MGAADLLLFTVLALADVSLMVHLYRRRARRVQSERVMRSLRTAVRREIGEPVAIPRPRWSFALQRAS